MTTGWSNLSSAPEIVSSHLTTASGVPPAFYAREGEKIASPTGREKAPSPSLSLPGQRSRETTSRRWRARRAGSSHAISSRRRAAIPLDVPCATPLPSDHHSPQLRRVTPTYPLGKFSEKVVVNPRTASLREGQSSLPDSSSWDLLQLQGREQVCPVLTVRAGLNHPGQKG